MPLLGSLLNRNPFLSQLFTSRFADMAPSPHKTTTPSQRKERTLSKAATPQVSTPPSPKPVNPRPKRTRRIARIIRPEPGSLYDIMHDHAGESLYVIPLCWTDAHARLLGAKFIDCDPILRPFPDLDRHPSRYPQHPSPVAQELTKNLTAILSQPPAKSSAHCITKVMDTLFELPSLSAKTGVDLDCHFGPLTVEHAVRGVVMWTPWSTLDIGLCCIPNNVEKEIPDVTASFYTDVSQPSYRTSLPVIAFVNRSHLAFVRRNLYRVAPRSGRANHQNVPVANLQRLRSKRLVPAKADHDSFIVATMLAMAQSRCYPPGSRFPSRNSSFRSSQSTEAPSEDEPQQPVFRDVPVIILSQDSDTAEFVVYKAVVSTSFLKRFAEPTKAPVAKGGLEIEVTRVPVWPVLGLKERLAQAMDLFGAASLDFSDDEFETWETPLGRQRRLDSLKRRRDSIPDDPIHTSFQSTNGDGLPGRDLCASALAGSLSGAAVPPTSPSSPRTPKRRRTKAINELEVC
ncbi:hypothetical protein BD289DRAFT_53427 [Coniella lustricola]|uniref:Uncharacterized protein n=1 Tax=Coniella lustricola TaxID=2025994 RepID=A0A2T3A0X4_9PEZI|nr:hypothetical protein BD289DRAFT_53427 [Coniella lustricola]